VSTLSDTCFTACRLPIQSTIQRLQLQWFNAIVAASHSAPRDPCSRSAHPSTLATLAIVLSKEYDVAVAVLCSLRAV
jgi:hypothetical protein